MCKILDIERKGAGLNTFIFLPSSSSNKRLCKYGLSMNANKFDTNTQTRSRRDWTLYNRLIEAVQFLSASTVGHKCRLASPIQSPNKGKTDIDTLPPLFPCCLF